MCSEEEKLLCCVLLLLLLLHGGRFQRWGGRLNEKRGMDGLFTVLRWLNCDAKNSRKGKNIIFFKTIASLFEPRSLTLYASTLKTKRVMTKKNKTYMAWKMFTTKYTHLPLVSFRYAFIFLLLSSFLACSWCCLFISLNSLKQMMAGKFAANFKVALLSLLVLYYSFGKTTLDTEYLIVLLGAGGKLPSSPYLLSSRKMPRKYISRNANTSSPSSSRLRTLLPPKHGHYLWIITEDFTVNVITSLILNELTYTSIKLVFKIPFGSRQMNTGRTV